MRMMTSGTFHREDQRSVCAARLRQCVAWLVFARASKNALLRGHSVERIDSHRRFWSIG